MQVTRAWWHFEFVNFWLNKFDEVFYWKYIKDFSRLKSEEYSKKTGARSVYYTSWTIESFDKLSSYT